MTSKRYVFDIDGTICTVTEGNYEQAEPFPNRILAINALYEAGNSITLYTARGMGSSDNDCESAILKWEILTRNQLVTWGVKYHSLFMCKPAGDIYIDDKAIKDTEFFSSLNC